MLTGNIVASTSNYRGDQWILILLNLTTILMGPRKPIGLREIQINSRQIIESRL